jgi:hypothetical protein
MHLEIPKESLWDAVKHRMPTVARMEKVGRFLHAQVDNRVVTSGASGGESWPPVKLPPKSGEPALQGIEKSFVSSGTADGKTGDAEVSSDEPHIFSHQFGATIVPVKAKALWIPISDKAKAAQRSGNAPTMIISGGFFKGLAVHDPDLVKGVDFIFTKGPVHIPKRPMLPNSPQERDQAIRYTLKVLTEP